MESVSLPAGWSVATLPACPPSAARPRVLPLTVPDDGRWFRHGWQSWSASSWTPPVGGPGPSRGGPRAAPRHPSFVDGVVAPTGYGVLIADGATVCVLDPVSVALTPDAGTGVIVARTDAADRVADVRIAWRTDLDVSDGFAAVRALLSMTDGSTYDPDCDAPGWSSWTAFFEHIDAALLRGQLRAAEAWNRCDAALVRFGVDDGYQPAMGDWLDVRPSFGSTLRDLAARITDAGHVPGLWLSPLLAVPASDVVRRHPEWVLRDADGAPVVAIDVAHWGGPAHVLDATRADVADHLRHVAGTLRRWGWSDLKLDFLYAAALPGRHHDPSVGPARRLRGVLAAIRDGAATHGGVRLTGCGAPLWESRGLVDAMRVGPDVLRRWAPSGGSGLPSRHEASLRSTWRCSHERSFLHQATWLNDPDSVLLAGGGIDDAATSGPVVGTDALAAWRRWVADRGQVLTCSDDLTALPAAARDDWGATVARHAAAGRAGRRRSAAA